MEMLQAEIKYIAAGKNFNKLLLCFNCLNFSGKLNNEHKGT